MKCKLASDCTLPGARCVDASTLAEGRTETDAVCTDPDSTSGCMCYGPANPCDNPSQCGRGTRCALVLPDMATYCLPCGLACTPAYTYRRLSLDESDSVRAIAAICIDADPETCDTTTASTAAVTPLPIVSSAMQPSMESSPEPKMSDPFVPRGGGPEVSASPVVSDPFPPFPEPSMMSPVVSDPLFPRGPDVTMMSPVVSDPYPIDPFSSPTKTPGNNHSPQATLYPIPIFSPDDDEEDPNASYSPSAIPSQSYYDPYEPSSSPEIVDPFSSPSKSPSNTAHIDASMSPELSDPYYVPITTYTAPSPTVSDPFITIVGTPYMSQVPEPSASDEPKDPLTTPRGVPSMSYYTTPSYAVVMTPEPSGSNYPYMTVMPSESYYPGAPMPSESYYPGPPTPSKSYYLGAPTPSESYESYMTPSESYYPSEVTPRALPSDGPLIPDIASPSYSPLSSSTSQYTPYPTYDSYPYEGTPYAYASAEPSQSAEADAVCIAVNALSHLDMKDLVFPKHFRATVLCDDKRNCATPGHIVVHDGVPMMMKTYCEGLRVKSDGEEMCSRKVMFVNSPRMKYGQRIKSNKDGLEFTALAARFESKLEEHVMALVARVYA